MESVIDEKLLEETGEKRLNLVVHERHPKTGKVVASNPYRMFAIQGIQYFEKPKGSGNLYFKSGEPAGRLILGEDGRTIRVDEKAKHQEWKPAPSSSKAVAPAVCEAMR
jgi:hypothetical protein